MNIQANYGSCNAYNEIALFSGDVDFDSNGSPANGTTVLYSGILDAEGNLNDSILLPQDAGNLQLYCNGLYAPQIQACKVSNDGSIIVSNPYLEDEAATTSKAKAKSRALTNGLQLFPIDEANGFYSLVKWEEKDDDYYKFGYFDDFNQVIHTGKYEKSFTGLSKAFFYGRTSRPNTQTNSDGSIMVDDSGVKFSNKQYVRNSDVVNLNILKEATDENGAIRTIEDAEIELTFLFENAAFCNVVGYYYYPSDKVPSSPDQVKKIILAPTMSQRNQVPYFGMSSNERFRCFSQNAPLSQNTTIQLLFEDEEGNVTTKFPAGYTIGFFGIPDGLNVPYHPGPDDGLTYSEFMNNQNPEMKYWRTIQKASNGKSFYPVMDGPSKIATEGGVKRLFSTKDIAGLTTKNHIETFSQTPRYSNQEWNKDLCLNTEKQPYWVCFNVDNERLLFGFEDGVDESYDDCIFYINASPNFALNKQGLPDAPYVNSSYTLPVNNLKYNYWSNGTVDFQQTGTNLIGYTNAIPVSWAFEDCWPSRGDYDINDVIIEHRQLVQVDMTGKVYNVNDFYEVVQPAGSATNVNAFAVNLNSISNIAPNAITIYDKSWKQIGNALTKIKNSQYDETAESGSYIIFTDCNNEKNKIIRIERKYNGTITRAQFEKENQNPFIIPKFEGKGIGNRIEVHLPKQSPTSLMNKDLICTKEDAFFIDKNGDYPFAIEIPAVLDPSPEKTKIGEYYPEFPYWVSSKGKRYTGWYRSHQ